MKNYRTHKSSLFLIELILAIAFFISSVIFSISPLNRVNVELAR